MKEKMKDHYQSKDLMLSAALLAKGIPLLDTKDSGGYLIFYFGESDECQKLERKWWSGELLVSAPRYAESLKRLKNLIYARR